MFICDVLRDLVQFFQLKNVKNTHGRLFTKSETPPCVFFYQIAGHITYVQRNQ